MFDFSNLTDLTVSNVTVNGIFTSTVTVGNFTSDGSFNRPGESSTYI